MLGEKRNCASDRLLLRGKPATKDQQLSPSIMHLCSDGKQCINFQAIVNVSLQSLMSINVHHDKIILLCGILAPLNKSIMGKQLLFLRRTIVVTYIDVSWYLKL